MSENYLNSSIFRTNAINHLNSLEDIQSSLKIVNPGAWIWVVISMLVLLGILIWGVFGSITLTTNAQGIIFPAHTLSESERLINQNSKDHQEKIIAFEKLLNKKNILYRKHLLTESDILRAKEEYLSAKEEPSNLIKNSYLPASYSKENSTNTLLDSLIFIDHTQGKKISEGMKVYILPNQFSSYDYGYINARVVSISEYPISKQLAYSYLGNINLVDDFFANGAPYIARVRLQKNNTTKSGIAWTTKLGSPSSIQPGTIVLAKIIYKKCPPIKFLSKSHVCE
jgi:hypothetical protein